MWRINSWLVALPLALALAGCVSDSTPAPGDEDVVNADVALATDRTVIPIHVGGEALTPVVIKGRYGPRCRLHAGETWDLKLNNWQDTSIEVALNDTLTNCPLTITAVTAKHGRTVVNLPVSPVIKLGAEFPNDVSRVDKDGVLAFFANAKLWGIHSGAYTNNFLIEFVYSDDALACRETAPNAIYGSMGAVAVGVNVAPPNYDMTFDGLKIMVDAKNRVMTSSTGGVALRLPTKDAQPGEEWRVFDEKLLCCMAWSFEEIDQLYKDTEPVAHGELEGMAGFQIPWTSFSLLGQTLPATRNVIVRHTGDGGVYSYELLQVRFPGPAWD